VFSKEQLISFTEDQCKERPSIFSKDRASQDYIERRSLGTGPVKMFA